MARMVARMAAFASVTQKHWVPTVARAAHTLVQTVPMQTAVQAPVAHPPSLRCSAGLAFLSLPLAYSKPEPEPEPEPELAGVTLALTGGWLA